MDRRVARQQAVEGGPEAAQAPARGGPGREGEIILLGRHGDTARFGEGQEARQDAQVLERHVAEGRQVAVGRHQGIGAERRPVAPVAGPAARTLGPDRLADRRPRRRGLRQQAVEGPAQIVEPPGRAVRLREVQEIRDRGQGDAARLGEADEPVECPELAQANLRESRRVPEGREMVGREDLLAATGIVGRLSHPSVPPEDPGRARRASAR